MPHPLSDVLLIGALMAHPGAVTSHGPAVAHATAKEPGSAEAAPCGRENLSVDHKPARQRSALRRTY